MTKAKLSSRIRDAAISGKIDPNTALFLMELAVWSEERDRIDAMTDDDILRSAQHANLQSQQNDDDDAYVWAWFLLIAAVTIMVHWAL